MNLQTPELIAHWPLAHDTSDHGPHRLPAHATDVTLGHPGPNGAPDGAARFNGRSSQITIDTANFPRIGNGAFTYSAWIHTDAATDVVGQLAGKYDPATRRGFHVYALTNDGVTSAALAGSRQLSFGIDNASMDSTWTPAGRPGNAINVGAMTVFNGSLYAGTIEGGPHERGHLWRYAGGQMWIDLGNPTGCNAVHGLCEFQGSLYASVGRYAVCGSALGETLNKTWGGKVFRIDEANNWHDCGHPGLETSVPEEQDTGPYQIGKADDAYSLAVFEDNLYVVSNHLQGVWRYAGGTTWENVGPQHRVMSLTVYRGALHALLNGGPVYRYEGGTEWTDCGNPGGSTQTYGALTMGGQLYVGTWPEGEVFRYAGGTTWDKVCRLGYEMEVMAATLYNGKAYFGSLPMANVWRLEEQSAKLVGNLDDTPVALRRVWSMAVYNGRLFAGTLPGGKVQSFEAGRMATHDSRLPGGWHHVAAVRDQRHLRLYLDGVEVGCSSPFHADDFDLNCDAPFTIGFGAYEHFDGLMSDVRLHRGALSAGEIEGLARRNPAL